ncbi:sensor histidine kinase [Kineosporia sp. R_H_3]|uniref:sensor histidine kinase n=1 Tax=Kineosporia sp. R_H_3 TaxID=1961848 RepID=UPI0018E990C5|nr:sensor histidine kinase [Kineosporia sp. R_H_3]
MTGDRSLRRLAAACEDLLTALGTGGVRVDVVDPDGRRLVGSDGAVTGLGEGLVGRAAMHRSACDDQVTGTAAVAVLDAPGGRTLVAVLSGSATVDRLHPLAGALAPLLSLVRGWHAEAGRAAAAGRFVERALDAQEGERTRLARDIHDGVSQRLAGLGFHLSAALSLVGQDDDAARVQLRAARELADLAGAETRAAIGDLHPPVLDDLGLEAALSSLAREAGARMGGPAVGVVVDGEVGTRLPVHAETALYRIAQEALSNAVRHAAASAVDLVLEYGSLTVTLEVRDDGRGFDAGPQAAAALRPDAFGLRGMRERAELLGGVLAVTSAPGRGTRVRAQVPLRPAAE